MEIEVQPNDEPLIAHQIEEIDTNGYLIDHNISESKSDNQNDDDVYVRLEKDEYNDVIAKVFDTLDDAYMFYNGYALLHGFGMRIHTTYKNKVTNKAYEMKYVCNKKGFKDLKGKAPDGGVKKWRRDLRTRFEAILWINISKDKQWFVKEFQNAHNHELTVTPTKVMKHRSHRKFLRSMACKYLMSELSHSSLKPCHIKKVVNSMKNPLEPDVTSKQCADALTEERKQYKGKEFYGLIKHFQDKTFVDKNQYFKVDLFDDGSPRNNFWADRRSKDAYIKFRDVLVFDVLT
ncbi:FAR1-related sequence 5-like protein [Tanacetum coccineum]|uniref:FAR1-related sequence 5-like protein n=1 Tax=Tanacetum coccineum TaxID=301880 RepID=A0ABQ5DIB2_9ASTR